MKMSILCWHNLADWKSFQVVNLFIKSAAVPPTGPISENIERKYSISRSQTLTPRSGRSTVKRGENEWRLLINGNLTQRLSILITQRMHTSNEVGCLLEVHI
jgi:hypothetical protein